MSDVLTNFNSGKLWDFDGGIHPPEMKSQSNQTPVGNIAPASDFFIPVKQHAGTAGNILVKAGDKVLKGQPLTQGDNLRTLPVHAPTSGTVIAVAPYIAAHPSGLSETAVHIRADGKDQWRPQQPIDDFLTQSPEQLIEKIYQAGIAGLGGAAFPTSAKIRSAEKQVKLLIINGAECEPYITCDDRLMRDYADEIIEGIRILRYILRPKQVVIAIEDNKPEAVQTLKNSLQGANDMEIRVIPTKYPSGAAKQLIQVLTGMEVPSGKRSSSIGVLMHNVGTAFAVKRAVMDDEPLVERVVTLTGDKIPHKGNYWVGFGTPISFVLQQVGYQYDERLPVYLGGPMMGLALPNLNAPITKIANCILAPDHFEYAPPPPEQSCIRCSACSDACPVHLMPQQLYWFARSEDHDKSMEYNLMDCIECGLCAYVCPSHIPLIQYFRQEKAKIWDIQEKAQKAEEAKIRFEARQARLEKEERERKERAQRAAAARREEMAQQKGVDPVQAALERLKAKKTAGDLPETTEVKTLISDKGEVLPDNTDIMAQRKARRLARQQAEQKAQDPVSEVIAKVLDKAIEQKHGNEKTKENPTALSDKKSAVAAAIARAKAKKAAQQAENNQAEDTTAETNSAEDPKKAAVAAAIARAKAKKAAQQAENNQAENTTAETNSAEDPKKAAVAAAIARAKAKKAAQQSNNTMEDTTDSADGTQGGIQSAVENSDVLQNNTETDPRKAAVAAAIARAKAKKAAQQQDNKDTDGDSAVTNSVTTDPKKAAVAAAIARAKAKKAAVAQKNDI